MLALFLMGAQSTLFGPVKYGILPEHLPEVRLMDANALIQGSTLSLSCSAQCSVAR